MYIYVNIIFKGLRPPAAGPQIWNGVRLGGRTGERGHEPSGAVGRRGNGMPKPTGRAGDSQTLCYHALCSECWTLRAILTYADKSICSA